MLDIFQEHVFRLAGHSWKDRPEIKQSHARTGMALLKQFPRSHCLFLAVFVSGGFILPTLSVWHQVNNKSLNLCVIIALLVTKLWDCIATCRLQLSLYPKKLVLLHYPSWTQISVETQLVSDCFSTLIWTLASFFLFFVTLEELVAIFIITSGGGDFHCWTLMSAAGSCKQGHTLLWGH